MDKMPSSWIRITAAAVLVGGVAAATTISHNPVPTLSVAGVSPQAVAELDAAQVIKPADKMEFPQDAPPPAPALKVKVAVTPKEKAAPITSIRPTGIAPALPAAVSTPEADDPGVKNIALVGITTSGGQDTAWLMDVDGRNREQAAVGENALGFTVQTIGEDNVVLSRGGKKYGLRVGEKPVLMASASTGDTLSGSDDAENGAPGGFGGPRGPGGRGQFGGNGARAQFGSRGGFGNNGGGANRTFNGFGGSTPLSFGGGSASANSGGNAGGGARGGFGGGGGFAQGGGGGGFGGFGANSTGTPTSQFSSSARGATTNAQTARRRGVSVTGGESAMPTPAAIVNPQTQRRLGTSGTGSTPAFGTSSGTVSAFTNPNGATQGRFSGAAQTGVGAGR